MNEEEEYAPINELASEVPLRAIVPNLVTSLAVCAGITSISFSSEGRFKEALVALVIACICDGLDGRIARLLKASSKMGAELDSLADFVNFGVAPAMFMYYWMTGGPQHMLANGEAVAPVMVRLTLGAALFYAMCDCFRLARFNTMLEKPAEEYWKHFFTGVPAPGGCWMVLTPAIISLALDAKGISAKLASWLQNPYLGIFMLLFVGALMASRLPTISLKKLRISKRYMLPVMATMVLLISLLVTNFWLTIGVVGALYILTIPVSCWAFLRIKAAHLAKCAS